MDLEKYDMLMRVLEIGSLTKASRQCGYTVSGISRMVSSLEKEQGFPLVYRNHDGICPTEELQMLLPEIREILYQERRIEEMAARIRGCETGMITIGVAYSSYYRWIADKTEAFARKASDIKFRFVDGYSSELLEKMNMHEVDVCLISEREGPHRWLYLGEEELAAWLPAGHLQSGQDKVSVHLFEQEPYIDIFPGKDIDNARVFEKYHVTPNSSVSVADSFAAYCMVEAGLGISMNHVSSARKWNGAVAVLPLEEEISIPVGLAAGVRLSPIVESFWSFLHSGMK